MSLQAAAKHLAAQGRGPDKTLVHMSPKELTSLQQLALAHGGSLTINPETGLPEAGFLDDIMPLIVGAGLAYATGGTSLAMDPSMIGLGVGALETFRTGDIQKGVMAGLGAYGGAGLTGGIMSAGAEQIGQSALDQSAAESARLGMSQAPFDAAAKEAVASSSNADLLSKGIGSLGQSGGFTNLSNTMAASGGPSLARAGLAAAAPVVMGMQPQAPSVMPSGGPNPFQYKYQPNPTTPTPMPDVPGYGQPGQNFGREQRYFSGTYMPVQNAQDPTQPIYMAGGGSAHLGDYSDGGHLLRGPGDGVSDSIPATIGGKKPARLADGEFVVPARIVSELGNGSTEAGARQLYAMMDRVQKARGKTVGKGKVAKDTRANKLLPA